MGFTAEQILKGNPHVCPINKPYESVQRES
jgi:hypothetical protein